MEPYIVRCEQCIHFRSRPLKVVMENIQATHPLQLVHLDYLTIEVTEGGKDVHVVIIMDKLYVVCTGSGNIITDCYVHSPSCVR